MGNVQIAFYEPGSGMFSGTYYTGPEEFEAMNTPGGMLGFPFTVEPPNPLRWRVEAGELVDYQPPAPPDTDNVQWAWDAAAWRWVSGPTLAAARRAKAAAVNAERDARHVLPVESGGVLFDADPLSVDSVRGLILRIERGDGLPPGWQGWRVADNSMVWASASAADVLQQLYGLARAIEDRKQALMNAAWAHKAAIDALQTVGEVLAYDVSAGWPA